MKPSQLLAALERLIPVGMTTWIWGPPGVGKSDIVREAAARLKRPVIDVRCVTLDPVDLRGIPHVNGGGLTHWAPPSFLPRGESNAVLFFDELAQAPQLVQAACLQLTLDRRIGEYELPKDVTVIAASNRQEDRAGTHRVITPLLNRFVHLHIEVSHEDFHNWAVMTGVNPLVRGFLSWKHDLLHKFDPAKRNDLAFPTPRSWSFVSRILPACSIADRQEIVAGAVGAAAAAEFCAYCEMATKLPDPLAILKDPDTAPVPSDEPSVMYALINALTEVFRGDRSLYGAVAKYSLRMPTEWGVKFMRDCTKVDAKVLTSKEGQAWVAQNNDAILGAPSSPEPHRPGGESPHGRFRQRVVRW